ncbi:malto-oligosyltrehalose trehalohydrolase [Ideonella azotifigens]|nr:malto-oligosyltrehalose trehalohydrolase [Ideonella azotifigens]MCD2339276.1 malto-oligosyltrehalose trehalohydrolase [Ideonella azotifigens]
MIEDDTRVDTAPGSAAQPRLGFEHGMPFGANLLPDGGARFRLWAPAPLEVSLRFEGQAAALRVAAPVSADGWRELVLPEAQAGDHYQWLVRADDGEQAVPDPASRSNPQGVFEPSVLCDPLAFDWPATEAEWRGRPWFEAVCYELHPGCFTPEGTLDSAAAQLPRLQSLGVSCVQLMPLASAPGRFGWGYDGVLPYAPHPAYGEPEALKRFVATAHALGLMVMLDVVYNHFGPSGNFLPLYAPGFFAERHHNAWGKAINFDGEHSGPVREFFIHNALYWLEEFRLDGLRLDAVHAMKDNSSPDILEELSLRVREQFAGRQVHLVLENDSNDARRLPGLPQPGAYDGQWSGDFHHTLHVLLTGETEGYYAEYKDAPLAQLARCLSLGFARVGEPHLNAEEARAANPRRDATEPVPLPATVNFLQNHDQIGNRAFGERLATLVPDEAARRLAAGLLLLSPPVPLLFMGEEWGSDTPFLYFADWQGELQDIVREGRRREFAHFSAFADAGTRARIPDPCDEATLRRCRLDPAAVPQQPAAQAWWLFHQRLLAWRARVLTPRLLQLRHGAHEAELLGGQGLLLRWRFDDGAELLMAANLGAVPLALPPIAALGDNHYAGDGFTLGEQTETLLGPWAGRWRWAHDETE